METALLFLISALLVLIIASGTGLAPTPVARTDPAGTKLDDGYRTLVAFTADPDASFWEKSITPPGMDGGDEIDTTTMHNDTYRTKAPRALVTMTPFSMTVAYDPALYTSILTLINIPTTVTVHYPNGGSLAFYGYLRAFEPDALVEGTQPEATITVVPTNQDPTTGDEEDPVYTPPV